jgi:hypothetical protein
VASVVAYLFFPPAPTANYGELLLPPKTLAPELRAAAGQRWLLIATDDGDKLTAMRQVRLALGRNASRVDTRVLGPAQLAQAGGAIETAHIYLVDPHGNVMMRWPARPDRKRMLKDLERLLKASQIG